MEKSKIKVLLAEDNPGGSFFWERILAEIRDTDIEFIHIVKLSDVCQYIGYEAPDVILLDLSLPEGGGFEFFLTVYNMASSIPIIVVTGTDNQKLAVQTALEGAQDSLVKTDINGYLLCRSMRYAIGRQRHLRQLRAFSIVDELTGLYNRRGFLILAEQKIKLSDQTGQSLLLVFADLDGLKLINDTLGHHWGDMALMETAHVLREAFRETDILARLGGDEYVALLACSGELDEEFLIKRFQETVGEHNAFRERNFKLSVSIGIARYDPQAPCTAGDLLAKADLVMYQQKKQRKDHGDSLVFAAVKDPVRVVLAESLAETQNEAIVRLMLPILRKCGVDAGLSLQLSSWVAKGSRELKLNLLEMIEEMGGITGGPALRMALVDDSEEIAALAARVMGKIHFVPGLPVLLKVAKIREKRFSESEDFLTAVCRSLGDLAQLEGIPFLREIAGRESIPNGKQFSTPLRLEAIQALVKISPPEALTFLEGLGTEKDTRILETVDEIIRELRSA